MRLSTLMILSLISTVLLTSLTPSMALAEDMNGIFMVVKGDVTVTGKDNKAEPAKVGKKVVQGDIISAGKEGRAKIVMADKNVLNISPETQIKIEKYENDGKDKKNVELNVLYGKVRASVEQKYDGEKSKFNIKTPSAVAGVRGTDFLTGYNPATKAMSVITFAGSVAVGAAGPGGAIVNPVFVNPGQMTEAKAGGAPSKPQAMPKEEMQKLNNETKADTAKNGDNKQDQQQAQQDSKKDDKKDDKKEDKNADKRDDGGDKKADKGDKNSNDKKNADNSEKQPADKKEAANDNKKGKESNSAPADKNNADNKSPSDKGGGDRNNGGPNSGGGPGMAGNENGGGSGAQKGERGPASTGGGSMMGPGGGGLGMGPVMIGASDLGPDLGKDINFRGAPLPTPVVNFTPVAAPALPPPPPSFITDAVKLQKTRVNIQIQAPQ